MRVLVLTTSYPRSADDVAGVFVRDAVGHLREAGVEPIGHWRNRWQVAAGEVLG